MPNHITHALHPAPGEIDPDRRMVLEGEALRKYIKDYQKKYIQEL